MNIMLILVAICALWKVIDGYRKGMVKEIVSLVTLTVMGFAGDRPSSAERGPILGQNDLQAAGDPLA